MFRRSRIRPRRQRSAAPARLASPSASVSRSASPWSGFVWLYLSRATTSAPSSRIRIPPPEYAYLADNPRVLVYLGQIEGGLSSSETRTRNVTEARTGGVAAGGRLGGSASRGETVQETVTPTETARFYRLLDRLGDKGYLRELNASSPPATFAKALADVPEGFFIRIAGCKLRVPTQSGQRDHLRFAARDLSRVRLADGGGGTACMRSAWRRRSPRLRPAAQRHDRPRHLRARAGGRTPEAGGGRHSMTQSAPTRPSRSPPAPASRSRRARNPISSSRSRSTPSPRSAASWPAR